MVPLAPVGRLIARRLSLPPQSGIRQRRVIKRCLEPLHLSLRQRVRAAQTSYLLGRRLIGGALERAPRISRMILASWPTII